MYYNWVIIGIIYNRWNNWCTINTREATIVGDMLSLKLDGNKLTLLDVLRLKIKTTRLIIGKNY